MTNKFGICIYDMVSGDINVCMSEQLFCHHYVYRCGPDYCWLRGSHWQRFGCARIAGQKQRSVQYFRQDSQLFGNCRQRFHHLQHFRGHQEGIYVTLNNNVLHIYGA